MTDVDPAAAVIWPKWCYSVVKKASKPITLPLMEKSKVSESGPAQRRRRKRAGCEGSTQVRPEGTEPGYRSVSPETPSGSGGSSPAASSSSEALSGPASGPLAPLPASTVTSYSDLMRQLAAKYNAPDNNRYSSPITSYGNFNHADYGSNVKSLDSGPTYSDKLPAPSVDPLQPTPFLSTASPLPFTCFPSHLTAFSRLPMLDLMRRSSMAMPISVAKEPPTSQPCDSGTKTLPPTSCDTSRKRSRSPGTQLPPVSSPLDLSAIKRSRGYHRKVESNNSFLQETSRSPPVANTSRHVCTGSSSSEDHPVDSWSVSDVLKFVETVDDCSEYVKLFEEHRINGRALAMMKAEYLTNILGMKLGPALQFCAELGSKLGVCPTCAHCSRCHSNQDSSPIKTPIASPSNSLTPASHCLTPASHCLTPAVASRCLSPSSARRCEAEQSRANTPAAMQQTVKPSSPITADC